MSRLLVEHLRSTQSDSLDTALSLAQFLNVSLAAVRKWTRTKDMPVVRAGRAVRYDRTEVLDWLRARSSQENGKERGDAHSK